MKTSEIIEKLEELIKKNGDVEFGVYKSYSKETTRNIDLFFDEEVKDICIGIYA